jgi:hypothetical protein
MAIMDAGAPVDGGKISKEQAQYRKGNPLKHCGLCQNYVGSACTVVEGKINPYMISNKYHAHLNPLQADGVTFKLKGGKVWRQNRKTRREAPKAAAAEGPAKEAASAAPTRIGNKVY